MVNLCKRHLTVNLFKPFGMEVFIVKPHDRVLLGMTIGICWLGAYPISQNPLQIKAKRKFAFGLGWNMKDAKPYQLFWRFPNDNLTT